MLNTSCRFDPAILKMSSRFLILLQVFFLCFSASLLADSYINVGTATLKSSPETGNGVAFDTVLDPNYLTTENNGEFRFVSQELFYKFKLVVTYSGSGGFLYINLGPCQNLALTDPIFNNLSTITHIIEYPGNPFNQPDCTQFKFQFNVSNGNLEVCNVEISATSNCN